MCGDCLISAPNFSKNRVGVLCAKLYLLNQGESNPGCFSSAGSLPATSTNSFLPAISSISFASLSPSPISCAREIGHPGRPSISCASNVIGSCSAHNPPQWFDEPPKYRRRLNSGQYVRPTFFPL